jgi:hypothetical protein
MMAAVWEEKVNRKLGFVRTCDDSGVENNMCRSELHEFIIPRVPNT